MTAAEIYALPVNGDGWRILPGGIWVRLGNGVTWEHSPLAVQGSRHLAVNVAPGILQIGCCELSFAHWAEHVLGIARQHGYSDAQGLEYQRIVAFMVANGVPEVTA